MLTTNDLIFIISMMGYKVIRHKHDKGPFAIGMMILPFVVRDDERVTVELFRLFCHPRDRVEREMEAAIDSDADGELQKKGEVARG